jgi:hypothetical protein
MNEILCWIKERALPTYANSRCLAKSYGQRLRACNVRNMDPEKLKG